MMMMKQFPLVVLCVLMLRVSKVMSNCTTVDLNIASEVETSAAVSVTCGETSIVVTIDLCVFKRMGYTEADFSLVGDSSVTGHSHTACADSDLVETNAADIKTFTITGDFTACGTVTDISNDANIVYKNAVRSISYSGPGPITRRKNALFDFSCSYQRAYDVTAAINVLPTVVAVEGSGMIETGDFLPTVQLCKDNTCTTGIGSGEVVDVLTTVYLVIETVKDLHIQIIDIDATDTPDPTGASEDFELTKEGCVTDSDAAITNNGISKSLLEFPFFHFTSDENDAVYFHVVYKLCDADTESCDDPCAEGGRRRRAARPAVDDNNLIYTTIGPFRTRVK